MAQINWTKQALSDLSRIAEYIEKDSPFYAARVVGKIKAIVEILGAQPLIGRTVVEAPNEHRREIVTGAYRIIYRIQADAIFVLAVIHGARDFKP
jgi:toxin ParE1/3/4